MLNFEVILKYEEPNKFPAFSWKQDTEPNEIEILETLEQYASKHKVPKKYLEDKAVVFVDAYENGLFTDPEVYGIDFSRLRNN